MFVSNYKRYKKSVLEYERYDNSASYKEILRIYFPIRELRILLLGNSKNRFQYTRDTESPYSITKEYEVCFRLRRIRKSVSDTRNPYMIRKNTRVRIWILLGYRKIREKIRRNTGSSYLYTGKNTEVRTGIRNGY